MNQRFAIVGMPRSGKSSLGRCMALKLKLPFYDLDTIISEHLKLDLKKFISSAGEVEFRRTEHEQLIEFLNHAPLAYVLACGGGTPCFHNNMKYINQQCRSIFIDADLNTIEQRILKEPHALFDLENPADTRQWIVDLHRKRSPYYEQSALIMGPDTLQSPYLFTKRLYLFTKA